MLLHHFRNEIVNTQIAVNGYAVVPFASPAQVKELTEVYYQLPGSNARGTHVTMFNASVEYRKVVDENIKTICSDNVAALFSGYRALFANYMVKEPGPEGDFPLHQDWTYVDESKFSSYAIWVPLCDVNELNGALSVVPGSHKLVTALRGPYVYEPFSRIGEVIKEKYSKPIRLRAGEALIWDHRLIHFSRPNYSDKARLALTLIMVPGEAPVIHCFAQEESNGTVIEKYRANTEFFLRYTIGKRPEGLTLLETCVQQAWDITENDFAKLVMSIGEFVKI